MRTVRLSVKVGTILQDIPKFRPIALAGMETVGDPFCEKTLSMTDIFSRAVLTVLPDAPPYVRKLTTPTVPSTYAGLRSSVGHRCTDRQSTFPRIGTEEAGFRVVGWSTRDVSIWTRILVARERCGLHTSHVGNASSREIAICIAEDRASCEPALRILIASLARHCPGQEVALFAPNATPNFREWLTKFAQVALNPWPLMGVWTKYDIKPIALMTVLGSGAAQAIWIDSDIVVTRDFCSTLGRLDPSMIAITEEALSGGSQDHGGLRARLWGLDVGQPLPSAANTAVVRVTQDHVALLDRWNSMLQSDVYRRAQAAPWYERPAHLAGDQEVLTALLASREFAYLPRHVLKRGRDIVQFFGTSGYTLRERVGHIGGFRGSFVHSQATRPWWPDTPAANASGAFATLYAALSPYLVVARQYADVLDDAKWLKPPTPAAHILTVLGVGHMALTGLPLAFIADSVRWLRAGSRRVRALIGRSPGQLVSGEA